MGSSIKSVVKLVTAPIKALYDPVGAFKDVFGGVQGIFAGLTGAAKTSGASSSEPSSQTVRSSKAPVRFILGRASTGGVLAWVQEEPGDQTGGEWLHIVYVLSEGAIAGVDEIYVDERPLSDLGENATSEVIINPAQVNAFLLSKCPDWRQEQIGRGLSFVRLSFKYDAEKFPSGIPDVRFVVSGRSDVYDPRNGAVGYSANTALLILWYLRNRCAIPDDEIIFDSFASSANVCDEPVFGPDGKISPRYFAGAVIGADEKRNTVLDNLLSACAGTLIRVGGRWSLQVGAYYGPADFTVNEDMVIGTVEGTTEVSNSDAINTMRGTFVDPAQAWAETDYPEVAIQDWITKDGGELAESQSFAYVTDAYLAQRLANISLRRRRSGGSLSVPLNFNGYNCRPGRAVKVDLPSLNILGEFMVTEWTMGAADACKVTLKPYEQAIFDDAVGQPYDPLGFINLPVGGLAAVTGLAWAPSGVAEVIQGVLSWTPPLQTVLSYTVTIRKGTEVVQSLKVGGEAASCNINGLTSGVYTMSVIAFGPGTRSGEATINVNVGGPPVPESCAFYASVDTITLVPANRQSSLNGGTYEYFYTTNPLAPIADAVYLGQGLTFTHTGLAFAKEYFYYVRSANAYGKSDFLFVPAATSSDPTQMLEVIAGRITESELGKELTERIDLVDMNGPGSVNERVGEVRNELNEQIAEVNSSIQSVNESVTVARDELQQQINAVDQDVEAAKIALQQQIAAVDQEVDAAKADLQQQINSVSVLAGSLPYNKDKAYSINQGTLGADGKLYQALKAVPKNNPPPNATYWTDVGQAIVTAAGTAARVSKVETDVTTLDGKTTAQATQLNGLQASLTSTNQNVTTAQQAAEAANTLAGGKGKVIIQAAAPAAADRLAQNLWIDTTGNANTPKRWSGSAWVAVTDKAATDAAAAAASALALAQTKADATVVNNLTLRVSDAEGKLVAEGQRLDGMQTSLDGKATSAALQQVTSRVTATEGKNAAQDQQISSQSSAIVSLTDSVAKKAEVSTVQALSNLVNQQGQDLTAQGQALVSINAALPTLGGENLVYNPSFERQTDNNGMAQYWWYDSSSNVGSRTPSLVPSTLAAGVAQRLDVTDIPTNGWARVYLRASLKAIKVRPGAVYTASVYMRGTAGLRILAQVYSRDAAGANSVSWPGNRVDAAETWQRVSVTFTATDKTVDVWPAAIVYGGAGVTAGFIEVDQYQLEEGSQASGWRDNGQVEAGNQAATAAAVDVMSAKVIQQGADLASVSSKTTSLENSLTTTNGNVATAQQAAQAASDAAGAKGKVLYQSTAPAVADRLPQNLWIDTTGNANTPKRWNGSTWVAVSDKVATDAAAAAQSALNQVAQKADASVVSGLTTRVSDAEGKLSSHATRLDGMQTSIDGKASSQSLEQVTNRVTATEQKDAAQDQQLSSQSQALVSLTDTVSKKAEAAAVQALSNDVKQQGQTQSAQGKSLTDLNAKLLASQDNSPTKVYQSVFSDMAVDQWANLFGGPTASTVFSNEEGNTSGATIKVSGGAGNSTWWGASTRKIRFDPTRLYKLSIRFKQLTAGKGNPITYAGVDGFAEDGVTRINSSGANTKDSSHYVITAGRSHPIGEWMEFTTHVKGYTVGSEGGGAGAGTVADPKRLKTGIAWISPMLVAGYNNIGGELAVDYFLIEDVTEQAQIDAGATATNALAVRVEKNEQGLTSVSNQAVQLENSLTTTNQNVTNAQNAAQAASNLAGSKGKVIVQRETPAAADQLAQNLWIDITNGANTPKRWTTSGWLPVTDKVAVDAAAAAANALSEVAKKADASALQSLNSKVDQQGRDLTATSSNVVSLGSTIGRALDNSPTKVYQSVFSDMSMDQWVSTNSGAGATASYGAPAGISWGAALILNGGASNRAWWGASTRKIRFDPSRLYKLTVRVQQVLMGAGSPGTYAGVDCFAEDGVTRIATSGVNSVGSSHYVVLSNRKIPQGEWLIAEVYVKGHTTGSEGGGAGAGTLADPKRLKEGTAWFSPMLIAGYDNMGGQAIFDFFDIEDVTEQAQLDAGAAATSALGTRITQTEQGLTSASNQLTELNNNIGDVGGENLVFNPSFERADPGTPGMADGWWHDGTGSGIRTPTLVQSTLASGVAQRLDVSGLSPATWARAYVKSAGRFKPVPGKTYTASVYLRGTPGLRVLPGVYGTNEAGAGTESWGAARTDASESWVRLSVTFTPGPTTTKLFAAFVVYGGASVSGGYIEADRYQIEEGTRVTGWRDNGQVASAQQAATSAAVESLSSAVSQQAGTLSSVGSRTTSLENNLTTTNGNVTTAQQAADAANTLAGGKGKVIIQAAAPAVADRLPQNLWIDTTGNANTPKRWSGSAWVAVTDKAATDAAAAAQSALTQVATKASASSVDALTQRVTSNEGGLASQSSSILDLRNSVAAVQKAADASVGLDPAPGCTWQFDNGAEGWYGANATAVAGTGFLKVTATASNPQLQSAAAAIGLTGALFTRVRARITRRGGSGWRGTLYYATPGHGFSSTIYSTLPNPGLAIGDSAIVEWDMENLNSGGTDWVDSTISRLRLDLGAVSGDVFDVDWIVVGRVAPAASSRALSSVESTVTQQGSKLTAETLRIDGLYTAVGDANAAIQNEAKARVDGDGALSKQIQTTQASLGTTNAAVQQVATAQANMKGMLNAQYTLRVQVNNQYGVHHFAGFGIGINEQNGVVQSAFAVYSDQFILLNANGGGLSSPFSVVGGQTFIADAYIRSASIGNAKIADGAITAAKIGVAEIDTLRIRGNAVTVPVSANSPGNVLGVGVGQWQNLIAVGVQMDEAGFITAQYSGYQGFGSGIRKYMFQMDINGLVIAQGGGDWADGFPNLMGSIGVGPGYFVITVKWWGENSGVGVQNHTLYAMGTKR